MASCLAIWILLLADGLAVQQEQGSNQPCVPLSVQRPGGAGLALLKESQSLGGPGVDMTHYCSDSAREVWLTADKLGTDPTVADRCEDKELQRLCPEPCQYVVRPELRKAFFACIKAGSGECAAHNRLSPFPNPETKVCERCNVENCKICNAVDICYQCHSAYTMSGDNRTCIFELGEKLHLPIVLPSILGIIVFSLGASLLYRLFFGKLPETAMNNLRAVRQGRKHRHFCKVQDWHPSKAGKKRFPLCTNLHRHDVAGIGVGFGLFYNSLIFQFCSAVLCFVWTFVVCQISGVAAFLRSFDNELSVEYSKQLEKICMIHSIGYGLLYIVLFIGTFVYAWLQFEYNAWFEASSTGMDDYVVRVEGLPTDVQPDEALIRNEMQLAFSAIIPDIELEGVSLAYDFVDRYDEVEKILYDFVQEADIRAGIYHESLIDLDSDKFSAQETRRGSQAENFIQKEHEDADKVRGWFPGGSNPMGITGLFYCVFKYKGHQRALLESLKATNGGVGRITVRLGSREVDLSIAEEFMEPPAVYWWALGLTSRQIFYRCAVKVSKIMLAVVLVGVGIFGPISMFMLEAFADTGYPPPGWILMSTGILTGIIYGQFYLNTHVMSAGIGFHRKDSMDRCVFSIFLGVICCNAVFQLGGTLLGSIRWPNGISFSEFFGVTSMRAIVRQDSIVSHSLDFMNPGLFFMPRLLEPIGAGFVPYILHQLFALIVYVWNAFPGPLGAFFKATLPFAPESSTHYPPRNAEKALDCMEIALPYIYADNMLVQIICFGMLFNISGRVHRFFLVQMIWVVFLYCYLRWLHLRFNKRAFFTTRSLDTTVNMAWGIPLSCLAVSASGWYMRIGSRFKNGWVLTIPFACSMALWCICYQCLRRRAQSITFEKKNLDVSYDDARKETLYSWFNVNPIFVLKCHFCPELVGDHVMATGLHDERVCLFEVGKEYLLLEKRDQTKALQRAAVTDWWEIETYLDAVFGFLEYICSLRRVCCCIDRDEARASDKITSMNPTAVTLVKATGSEVELMKW